SLWTRGSSRGACAAGARTRSAPWITRGSEPRPRADARDVEARGRDPGAEHPGRVALVVVVARPDEGGLAREAGHVREQLRHGDGPAQVHERLRDLAAANAEGPV